MQGEREQGAGMKHGWAVALVQPEVLALTIPNIFYVVVGTFAIISLLYDVRGKNKPPEQRGWTPLRVIILCGVGLVVVGNLVEMASDW